MNVFLLVGWRVKQLRLARGLSQDELSSRLGEVTQGYISELENGKGNPTLQILYALSRVFGVSLPELVTADGVPPAVLNTPTQRPSSRMDSTE
ncbi:helix-turn-helix transcriptional regulator [Asticcacaulis sp. YBE204]|uniref:helix-turn-helix domain-containing protein n=1 Tax=Asticcacaulis sp. YBE204 TaxID=1282363 RepID=UPI000555E0E6